MKGGIRDQPNTKPSKYDRIIVSDVVLQEGVGLKCEYCGKMMFDHCKRISKARYVISWKPEIAKYVCRDCI